VRQENKIIQNTKHKNLSHHTSHGIISRPTRVHGCVYDAEEWILPSQKLCFSRNCHFEEKLVCYEEVNLAWKIISHQLLSNKYTSNTFRPCK